MTELHLHGPYDRHMAAVIERVLERQTCAMSELATKEDLTALETRLVEAMGAGDEMAQRLQAHAQRLQGVAPTPT